MSSKQPFIRVIPLGAGQDVGRSCVLVTMGSKNIMFDCGMHMGYSDHRRFPDFTYISKSGDYTSMIDCVIISHFHLDHCGALPYFTEICGYDGPIYMTGPTKAIAPILLEDMRKVVVERKGETDFFTSVDIKNCMQKVIAVNLMETVQVDAQLEIRPYYAGHVLGAAMFYVRVTDGYGVTQSVVYTGDYNMTPDRHLGAAQIDGCEPDLIITETTYATTIRDSKRARERDFLKKVHDCVSGGGKVLVPVFALGRAQELLILIESYWRRMDDLCDKVPVYFSTGLTERANEYYKLFISWTNENVKSALVERNMFDFAHIRSWSHSFADEPGAMVLFATPGMLHAGTSLEVFKKWCHDPKNMIIMPGYCVAGTVGAKVLAGEKVINVDRFTKLNVNLQISNLSFSAHADAKGILQLIRASKAKNVMLVHGEKKKMAQLKIRIERELGIPCFDPANGAAICIPTKLEIPALVSKLLVSKSYARQRPCFTDIFSKSESSTSLNIQNVVPICDIPLDATLIIEPCRTTEKRVWGQNGTVVMTDQLLPATIRLVEGQFDPKSNPISRVTDPTSLSVAYRFNPMMFLGTGSADTSDVYKRALKQVYDCLCKFFVGAQDITVSLEEKGQLVIVGKAVRISPCSNSQPILYVSWEKDHQLMAIKTLAIVNQSLQNIT
ncbi:Integrator complex subunit 11 [Batrachochytrium dendrobatidis]|nr:Integrator complex subunit 11 [Batrachochytrium dendrobatidis]